MYFVRTKIRSCCRQISFVVYFVGNNGISAERKTFAARYCIRLRGARVDYSNSLLVLTKTTREISRKPIVSFCREIINYYYSSSNKNHFECVPDNNKTHCSRALVIVFVTTEGLSARTSRARGCIRDVAEDAYASAVRQKRRNGVSCWFLGLKAYK